MSQSGPYAQVIEGVWSPVKKKGHREQCCGCCLIHVTDYRVIENGRGYEIEYRTRIDERATARIRKRAGIRLTRSA